MDRIHKAVILVAGLGSRLKPLTDEVPKCLTEINGKPILHLLLDTLADNGIAKAVIVIGYLGDVVVQRTGYDWGAMSIEYIRNDIYDETNSMYSAWLARESLESGALLIEGDTVYESKAINEILKVEVPHSLWAAEKFSAKFQGSMSTVNSDGRIQRIEIIRDHLPEYNPSQFKSAGLLKITPEYGKMLSRWLDEEVNAGNVRVYYDLVIAKHLNEAPVNIFDITGTKWFEIDSLQDLRDAEEEFIPSKYVVFILDGAADFPLEPLSGKTPFEAAAIPSIDALARAGMTGMMRTMYPGLPVDSIVATMGILGYNPARYYPNGRASFEALAQDIYLEEGDIAFRCNLVSLDGDILKDFTAGNISDTQARLLVSGFPSDKDFEICAGQSYRNILVARGANCTGGELLSHEPHSNIGKPVESLLLEASSDNAKGVVAKLNKFMLDSQSQMKALNATLNTKADMLFIWSPSSPPRIPAFHRKYSIGGTIICGLDFLRGIGVAAGLRAPKVPGATGYSDTALDSKLTYAKNALAYSDLVMIHINAPDEESHRHDALAKTRFLERIDKELVKPLVEHLETKYPDNYRISIMPDHYTCCADGKHADKPVPFLISGKGIGKSGIGKFSERAVANESHFLLKSYEFMDFFLHGGLS